MLLLHFVTSVTFFTNNAAVFDRQSSIVNKDLIEVTFTSLKQPTRKEV